MENIVLTRAEAAEALKVSIPTIDAYLHRAENPLPAIRLNTTTSRTRVLIPAELFSQWVKEEAVRCSGKQIEG